ncbi:MAG: hypothetical protein ACE5GZ_10250 [Gammaproteobacteria bacterium]
MNFIAVLFIILVLAMIIYTGTRLALAIRGNFQSPSGPRTKLAQRIRSLRMFPMLRKRGVPFDSYLYGVPLNTIERQVVNCEACDKLEECDRALTCKDNIDYSFCPNDGSFRQYQDTSNS